MSGIDGSSNQIYRSSFNAAQGLGHNVNIQDLGLLVQMERYDIMQSQVRDQFADAQKRNEWLKDANAALAALRTNRPTDDKAVKDYGQFTDSKGVKQDAHTWMLANGIAIETTGNDKKGMASEFDAAIQNLKASIDSTNSDSQMDMIRLQGLMDKTNQSVDFMTNWIGKNNKSLDSVIGNIR